MRCRCVLVLLIAGLVPVEAARAQPDFRMGGMEDRPRTLTLALHPEYGVAYDLSRGTLFRMWKGSVEHADEGTVLRGHVFLRDTPGDAWRLRVAGRDTTARVDYLGVRKQGGEYTLTFRIAGPDGAAFEVDETPVLLFDDVGLPVLHRRFAVRDLPPEAEVLLRVGLTHAVSNEALSFDGRMYLDGSRRHTHAWGTTFDVSGWVALRGNDTESNTLVARFDPAVARRLAGGEAPDTPEAYRKRPPVALRAVPGVEVGADLVRNPSHRPGVTVRTYYLGRPIDHLVAIAPGQLPNAEVHRPAVDLVRDAEFGGLSFHFVTCISGFLNIAQAGRYSFRLVADDGARLRVDGTTVVEFDGRHPAEPSPAGEVDLLVGANPFAIDHFQSTGEKRLRLEWRPPWASRFATVDPDVFSTLDTSGNGVSPGKKWVLADRSAVPVSPDAIAPDGMHPAWHLDSLSLDVRGATTALTVRPDGWLGVAGRGDVWIVDPAESAAPIRFAEGLDAPGGLAFVDDVLFVLQRTELTQLSDTNRDGAADRYRTVTSAWAHPWPLGSFVQGLVYRDERWFGAVSRPIDREGAVVTDPAPGTGFLFRTDRDGTPRPLVEGLQRPTGLAADASGNVGVTDYRNSWSGTARLLLVPFDRLMHPDPMPADSLVALEWPPVDPPALPGTPLPLRSGPYAGHLLLGDAGTDRIYRASLESVEGRWQGALFPVSAGFGVPLGPLAATPDGTIYAGAARDGSPALYRLRPTDTIPFELHGLEVTDTGFTLTFTHPVDAEMAIQPEMYRMHVFRGGDRSIVRALDIASVRVADDRRHIRIEVPDRQAGDLLYLVLDPRLRSAGGLPLWVNEAWYTLHGWPSPALEIGATGR